LTFAGLSADLLPEEDSGWIHSDRTERVYDKKCVKVSLDDL